MAGELAISAIEMMLTGDISSDNPMIRCILRDMEHLSVKNKDAHERSKESKRQARIINLKLETIAEMLKEGQTQKAIAAALGEKVTTINSRVKVLREEFSELLYEDDENPKNPKNPKHVNVNVNVNVNDNVNVTSASPRSGDAPRSPMLGGGAACAAIAESKENNFIF